MVFRRTILVLTSLSLVCSGLAAPAAAHSGSGQLKAALIYNILRFVDLGSGSNGAIDLCVVSSAPSFREISSLNRREVSGRSIMVRETSSGNLRNCDVVYLGSAGAAEIRNASASGRALIGDGSGFVNSGGTIGFVRMGNQIRFEINISSARAAGVSISSKLLRLASRVQQ